MLAAGLITRVVGLVGTLLIVRWVSPGEYGEALVAAVVVGSASTFSTLGVGQFVIVKARGRRDLTFHATLFLLALGAVALVLVLALQDRLGVWFNVPGLHRYLPGMALSMCADRLWFVPERLLMRDMRFATVALSRSAGDLGYTVVSLWAALLGWGGMAIVAGNVGRSAIRCAITLPAVDRRDWLQPCRVRRDVLLEVLEFGWPLAVGLMAAFVASRWDNLLVSRFFGPAVMAAYSIAYNLAGMASGLVLDQVIDVLVPSFTLSDARRRGEGLLRGASLLALVVTPLCLGLAAVAPTVVATLFDARWSAVAPMLAALSVAAVLGPPAALVVAYLQACERPKLTMLVQLVLAVGVVASVGTVGQLGPLWTCGAVGGAFFLCILAGGLVLRRVDGIPLHRLAGTQLGPILASLPMLAAVLGARWLLARGRVDAAYVRLAAEVAVGAAVYVGAALVIARPVARDLVALAHASFLKVRPAPAPRTLPTEPAWPSDQVPPR